MSADATATSGQLVIGETGSSGDEVSLGPPGTVFKGKKAGTTVVEAGMTASGGWMELGRFDGTTTIDMRGNAGTVDCNMVSTGPLAMDQYGIACDTATSTQALDITAPAGTNVYSNYGQSAGANLPPGGGSWSSISDRNKKENFEDVDAQSLLEKVAAMPMTTWNYKSQDESIRHMGPMAQDFKAAFGVGEDDKHISTVDADGVALAAIQALYDRVKALESENAELKVTNSEMGARLDRIEKVLANQNSGSDKLAVNK